MPKDNQEEALDKLLSAQLARTQDFVKFAETKNAALLTFSSAWILASVNLLISHDKLSPGYPQALAVALPLFLVAALVCIISFLPRFLHRYYKPADGAKSLLYFADVATFAPAAFKERIMERFKPAPGHSVSSNYLDDLCIQIAVNSQIATRKFKLFNIAAAFVLAAISSLLLPPLWWGIRVLFKSSS